LRRNYKKKKQDSHRLYEGYHLFQHKNKKRENDGKTNKTKTVVHLLREG
jgi:hypothetical protein